MVRINEVHRMERYIEKYGINELFSKDMTPFMELFFFESGSYICKEAEEINYLFFMVEGKGKVFITLSNGKTRLLCFYQGFTILGEVELVGDKNATSNVQAIGDVYCIGISLDRAREHLISDAKFLKRICNSLGEKLTISSNNSSINLLYPLKNRLSSYILAVGKGGEGKEEDRIEFSENLTEIAELLGTSYRHLLRTLNELVEKGILKKKNGGFEVIDVDKLGQVAGDLYR